MAGLALLTLSPGTGRLDRDRERHMRLGLMVPE
jgi:hypothetical protein